MVSVRRNSQARCQHLAKIYDAIEKVVMETLLCIVIAGNLAFSRERSTAGGNPAKQQVQSLIVKTSGLPRPSRSQ